MAIAFDAAAQGQAIATSLTYSHTCTGSNLTLVVSVYSVVTSAGISGVTYNGVSMSSAVAEQSSGNQRASMWYLANPATGANNIVVTGGAAVLFIESTSVSLTGTNSSPLGGTNFGHFTGTHPSTTVTTVANNSWLVDMLGCNAEYAAESPVPDSPGIERVHVTEGVSFGISTTSSTGATTTAGANGDGYTKNTSGGSFLQAIEIKPAVAVGPANVKTWDGVAQSTGTKTYVGVTVANTKTVDGVN